MCIIPSVADAAKIFPLWLKLRDVIAGGSLPRGRTVFKDRRLLDKKKHKMQNGTYTHARKVHNVLVSKAHTIAFHVFMFHTVTEANPKLSKELESYLQSE